MDSERTSAGDENGKRPRWTFHHRDAVHGDARDA